MRKCLVCFLLVGLWIGLSSIAGADVRDIVKIGGDVVVEEGMRVGDVVAVGGDVTVNGIVEGDAVAVGGSVTLGPEAVVGSVVCVGGIIEKEEGAEIREDIVEVNLPCISTVMKAVPKGAWQGLFWAFRIIMFIGFLALALLIVAIVPKAVVAISSKVEKDTLKAILRGLLALVLIVPLAVLLAVSVVGILLIPLEFILVGCAFLVGYVAIAQLVGNKMAVALNRPNLPILWETFWGVIILGVIGWVPVLGWLVNTVVLLLGFGGVIVVLLSIRSGQA